MAFLHRVHSHECFSASSFRINLRFPAGKQISPVWDCHATCGHQNQLVNDHLHIYSSWLWQTPAVVTSSRNIQRVYSVYTHNSNKKKENKKGLRGVKWWDSHFSQSVESLTWTLNFHHQQTKQRLNNNQIHATASLHHPARYRVTLWQPIDGQTRVFTFSTAGSNRRFRMFESPVLDRNPPRAISAKLFTHVWIYLTRRSATASTSRRCCISCSHEIFRSRDFPPRSIR
jgi:hypothetical protein